MADEMLLKHLADIVRAHVSKNSVPATALPELIQSVYTSLALLGQSIVPKEEPRVPAVSIRASVRPEALICLDCGKNLKTLKRHLGAALGLTPYAYRLRWRLPEDYPMAAPSYSTFRQELALRSGLGRKSE